MTPPSPRPRWPGPEVAFRVSPCPWWQTAESLLAGLAAASAAHATVGHALTWLGVAPLRGAGLAWNLAVTAVGATWAALATRRWRVRKDEVEVRHTVLAFDGERWSWPEATRSVTLRMRLDFGSWMLVEVQEGLHREDRRPRQWLALSEAMDPSRWHALRVAVFAQASPVTLRSV